MDCGEYSVDSRASSELTHLQDFDGGSIGAAVTEAYLSVTGPKEQLSWYTVPASHFPNGESDIAPAIVDERAWVAVVSAYTKTVLRRVRQCN